MRRVAAAIREYGVDAQARTQARKRLPKWLVLLMPFVAICSMGLAWFAFMAAAFALHRSVHLIGAIDPWR